MGTVRKFLNILNRFVKKVYSQMISCLFVFYQLVGMRCYASMVTDYMISIKFEHYTCMVNLLGHAGHLEEAEKLVMAMPYEPHVADGCLFSALAEFLGTWRWQNILPIEFLKWSLTMLLVMCCCQTSMLLLAIGISVRMLNGRERKKV
jgi:pentatricopeptide repeat protein